MIICKCIQVRNEKTEYCFISKLNIIYTELSPLSLHSDSFGAIVLNVAGLWSKMSAAPSL